MAMRLIVGGVAGEFNKIAAAEIAAARAGAKRAVATATERLKQDLRADVRGAGLGDKLANSWRSAVYPKQGVSLSSAGSVFSKAPHIVSAFEDAVVIRGRDGAWLAIPTENAPKRGEGFNKRISPATWPEARHGRLRFVWRGGGKPALLVVDNQRLSVERKTGRVRGVKLAGARQQARGTGLITVVMFILVRQARMPKLLNVAGVVNRAAATLAQALTVEWERAAREGRKQ